MLAAEAAANAAERCRKMGMGPVFKPVERDRSDPPKTLAHERRRDGSGGQRALHAADTMQPARPSEAAPDRPQAAKLIPLQRSADISPKVTQLIELATVLNSRPRIAPPVQRVLAGPLKGINESYLQNFASEFPILGLYANRRKILSDLNNLPEQIQSDSDLRQAIHGILARPGLAERSEALPGPARASSGPSASGVGEQASVSNANDAPIVSSSSAILSVAPAEHLASVHVGAPSASFVGSEPESAESRRVMALYSAGLLLVTAVQRKDLAKMHNAESREAVSAHIGASAISMAPEAADKGGPLEYAKVNWTLTSPAMQPHYFKMINDKDSDRTPKPDSPFASSVTAPRVATLADPTAMGPRFMRGKTGNANLDDWEQDQSSSKAAGIYHGAPLMAFDHPTVSRKFALIKQQQEQEYRSTNPEINTFGFPPDAVVGFLVTSASQENLEPLRAAKQQMSPGQQMRQFPVFTWRRDGGGWTLVLLTHI